MKHLAEQLEFNFMNDNTFNPKVRAEYLSNPDHCPECKKETITAGFVEASSKQVWRDVRCESCGFIFQEIFNLVDIEKKI